MSTGDDSSFDLDEAIRLEQQKLADLMELKRLAAKLNIPVGKATAPAPHSQEPAANATAVPQAALSLPLVEAPRHFLDGSVASLIRCYRSDPRSPYQKLSFKVRANYDSHLKRLETDIGPFMIADLNKDKIQLIYEKWVGSGKLAMGHALVGKFRLVCSFGMTVLDDPACVRLSSIMHTMRFKLPEKRVERLTAAHAIAIRNVAHDMGWHSIALAQAIQFECKLRQLDTIGEWVPVSEPGDSDVVLGEEKWTRGLCWSEIDENLILRHTTTNRLEAPKDLVIDLKTKPMVMEEFDWLGDPLPKQGPVIINDVNDKPFYSAEFRRKWRIVATKAGVPENIRNTDSTRDASSKEQPEVILSKEERRVH